jgi:hypothetical protein
VEGPNSKHQNPNKIQGPNSQTPNKIQTDVQRWNTTILNLKSPLLVLQSNPPSKKVHLASQLATQPPSHLATEWKDQIPSIKIQIKSKDQFPNAKQIQTDVLRWNTTILNLKSSLLVLQSNSPSKKVDPPTQPPSHRVEGPSSEHQNPKKIKGPKSKYQNPNKDQSHLLSWKHRS